MSYAAYDYQFTVETCYQAASHAQSAKMWPIVADVAWSVCLSVCLLDINELC